MVSIMMTRINHLITDTLKNRLTYCILFAAMLAGGLMCLAVASHASEVASDLISADTQDAILGFVVERIKDHPTVSLTLMGVTSAMPLLGYIANQTKNPIDNALHIALNKVVQLFTFNTAKNQPDVLSVKQMLTNKPSKWPKLIADKVAVEHRALSKRLFR